MIEWNYNLPGRFYKTYTVLANTKSEAIARVRDRNGIRPARIYRKGTVPPPAKLSVWNRSKPTPLPGIRVLAIQYGQPKVGKLDMQYNTDHFDGQIPGLKQFSGLVGKIRR